MYVIIDKDQASFNKAVVVWLKYCRYDSKHKKNRPICTFVRFMVVIVIQRLHVSLVYKCFILTRINNKNEIIRLFKSFDFHLKRIFYF